MSITDELRKYARGCAGGMGGDALRHIADHIDAEHERAMAAAALVDGVPVADENMAEHGWIRLPKDANGVPICVGDVMETDDNCIRKVDAMQVSSRKWSIGLVTTVDATFSWHDADRLRHHHKPTVEDVLREFAYGLGVPVADSYIAASAAKLRLAGDAE